MKGSGLSKLIRLCSSITDDSTLISEFQEEIDGNASFPAITIMVKNQLKRTSLDSLGFNQDFLSILFFPNTITQIDLHSSTNLGIKCFFMSEGTIFPLHDHPNRIVITSVLYGQVRYLCLDKTQDPNVMVFSKKGTGKVGSVMLTTFKKRNVHTILAENNTIIIDIFMHNVQDPGHYYKIQKKILKTFLVKLDNHVHFLTRSFKRIECECED
jgi:PCO_ADO